jgi:hypothetical protein
MEIKEFTVKEQPGFRLRVKSWAVSKPEGIYSLDFIQENLDKDNNVSSASSYNFFMTKEEIKTLCEGLMK